MSTRETRIARVVRVRDERLKEAVAALEQARAVERKAQSDLSAALAAREAAEAARRERSLVAGDILEFILAEDWLRSQAILEELARHRAHKARSLFEKAQLKVKEAHIKVRQLEQLKDRLEQARRAKETRTERVLEDEIGQRVAQSQRGRR
jgi:hypothetical protein